MRASIALASILLIASSGVATADVAAGQAAYASKGCIGCHGAGGKSNNAAYPSLNGQTRDYIRTSLLQLRSGERQNAVMNAMAVGLTDEDIENLSDYIATLQ